MCKDFLVARNVVLFADLQMLWKLWFIRNCLESQINDSF